MTDKRRGQKLIETVRKPEKGESRERWVPEARDDESSDKQPRLSLENVCGFN